MSEYAVPNLFAHASNLDDMTTATTTRALWMEGYHQMQRVIVALRICASSAACLISLLIILAVAIPLFNRRNRRRPSTYNLYLAFLAVPDLICHGFLIYLFSTFEKHTEPTDESEKFSYIQHPFHMALMHGCLSTVLYISAFIAHEIYKLLRFSMRRSRYEAPTVRLATIQALIAYILGDLIFMWDYFLVNKVKNVMPMWLTILLNTFITVLIPLFYLMWVCFMVWKEKLICNDQYKTGKRLSSLVIYFSRIIATVCWMPPVMVLYTFNFAESKDLNPGREYYYASVLYAIQVFVSFGLALMKPDVRHNVVSLLSCNWRPRDTKISGASFMTGADEDDEEERPYTFATTTTTTEDDSDPNIFHFDGTDAPIDIDPCEQQQQEQPQQKQHFHWLRRMSHDSSSMFRMKDPGTASLSPFALEGIGGNASDTNMEASIRASLCASLPPQKTSCTHNTWSNKLGIPLEVKINDDDSSSEESGREANRPFKGGKPGARTRTISMAGEVKPITVGNGEDSDSDSTYG